MKDRSEYVCFYFLHKSVVKSPNYVLSKKESIGIVPIIAMNDKVGSVLSDKNF